MINLCLHWIVLISVTNKICFWIRIYFIIFDTIVVNLVTDYVSNQAEEQILILVIAFLPICNSNLKTGDPTKENADVLCGNWRK